MSSRKRRSIVSYYEPSPSSGSARWIDFRDTTYNTSSNAYVYSTTSNTSLLSLEIEDRLHEPRTARILIKNRPARPFSDDATIQGTQGPWSNTITEFTKIKVRDGETNDIYFYGFVYDVQDFMDKDGGILSLTCHDQLQEVMDKTTEGQAGYRISTKNTDFFRAYDKTSRLTNGFWGQPVYTFAQDVSTSDTSNIKVDRFDGIEVGDEYTATNAAGQTETITITSVGTIDSKISFSRGGTPRAFTEGDQFHKADLVTSRSGLIKSILAHHSSNITFGDNSAISTDERFQDSLVGYVTEDNEYPLSDSKTSILTKIQNLAVEDPHNSTLTDERTFGFDYFISPNFTDASVNNETPKGYFNYFRRGTFPSETQRFGTSGSTTVPSNGLFQQGLNIYHPSPSSTDAGSFSETGKLVPMTTSRFSRPKDEIFSAFEVSYVETPPNRSGIDNKDPQRRQALFMYVEANTITNADSSYGAADLEYGFLWNQDADSMTVENANEGGVLLIDSYHVSPEGEKQTFLHGTLTYNESSEFLNVRLKQLNAAVSSTSATTISVDSDARTAGFYVGQYIRVNNEIMKITALGHANNITVERGALGSEAGTHSDNDYVEARHVAKIQYVAKKAAYSSGSYQNISDTGVLLSHINPRLFDGDSAFNFDEYWTVGGSSKEWIGDESRSIMTLSYTPQNSYAFHRVGAITYAENALYTPNNIRERIFQAAQRNHTETLRGMVTTYRPPSFYFTPQIEVATGAGTQTNALTIHSSSAISGSQNPHLAGIKVGTTCNQLDSDENVTGIYGYVESVTSSSFTVKWSSGSGVSTNDKIRIDIPVRTGMVVKVKNDLVNVDTIFGVTKTKFTEDEGVRLTSYNIVGQQDQKRAYGYKTFEGAKGPEGPSGTAGFGQASVVLGFDVRATSRTNVKWAGGPLVYKGVTYEINPGSLTLTGGKEYVLYYRVGQNFLQAAERSIYLKQIKGVISGELVSVAVINTDESTSAGEYPRIGLQNHVKGPAVTDTTAIAEVVPGSELLFTSDMSTLTATGTIHGSYTLDETTTDDIDVTSLGFGASERPFYVGQKIVIENEELVIKAVDDSASPKHIDVRGRPSGVSHAAGTAIKGAYRHGRIRPFELDTGKFALGFDIPEVDTSNGAFSWINTFNVGTNIGRNFTAHGATQNARVQIVDSHLELHGNGAGNFKNISWDTNDTAGGSIYMNGGVLYVVNTLGVAAAVSTGSGSTTADDIVLGSDAQGDIYVRGSSALQRVAIGTTTYGGQFLRVNAAGNGIEWQDPAHIYLSDGNASGPAYTFKSDQNTGMYRHAADTIGFAAGTGGAGQAFIDDSGYIYARSGFTFSTDTNTYADSGGDLWRFFTGGANLRASFGASSVDITSSSGTTSTSINSYLQGVTALSSTVYAGSVRPHTDNSLDIGGAINRWDDVYATNSTIQTSDLRQKENINDTKLGLDFIKDLRPVSYDWKDKKENKINQTHYGLIAQEVLESLKKHGIDSIEDFGGISHDGDPEHFYGARYGEFVPILIKAVQELKTEIDTLKENK